MVHVCKQGKIPENDMPITEAALPKRGAGFAVPASGTTNSVNFARISETLKDPIAEWKGHFGVWINAVKTFRDAEQETFLADPDDPRFIRIHRGWICDLISTGEALAMTLIARVNPLNEEATQQLQFLDTFIDNLMSTLETWHPVEEPGDNPLTSKTQ